MNVAESHRPDSNGAYRLFLQHDVVDRLTDPGEALPYRKRLVLAMRQLAVRGRTTIAKGTRGAGAGWSRAPLGGNGGFQWYLWFARPGTPPARAAGLGEREVLVGAVRHHEHNDLPLDPGARSSLEERTIDDLREEREPFTPEQRSIIGRRAPVLFVKGQPGTGKTTALWLDLETRPRPGRVLYVTYGERLAREARAHLSIFQKAGDDIEVVTFSELLEKLAGRSVVLDAPREQVARMTAALEEYRQPWSIWRERPELLHTELHAHLVGRALPEPWRGRAACTERWLDSHSYVELREGKLGKKAAEEAARLGSFLTAGDALRDIAPGPFAAHDALDGLRAHGCPSEWCAVDEVVVDEVQDLTPVELLVVRELVEAIGQSRDEPPRLVLAGDEAQTVRPTDFEWAELASIVLRRLGPSEELVLGGNVRSPRTVGSIVRASWRLYQNVAKHERPRGSGDVEIDEATSGRVLLCQIDEHDDPELLAQTLRKLQATLVRPRIAVGDDQLSKASEGPDEVKGLDFELVAVLDAGNVIAEIQQHEHHFVEGGEAVSNVWARGLADGLRVALSRSTETLILLERTREGAALVRARLCSELLVPTDEAGESELADGFVEVGVSELESGLAEAADLDETMDRLLNDAPKYVDEQPRRALELARRAAGLRGRKGLPGAVIDDTRRREAARWRAIAAVHVAEAEDTKAPEATRLLDEARSWFTKADAPKLAELARCMRAMHSDRVDAKRGIALCEAYRSARSSTDELQRVVERALLKLLRGARLTSDPNRLGESLELVLAAESLFSDQAAALGICRGLRLDIARKLVELGRWAEALRSLREIDDQSDDELRRSRLGLEALCHERGTQEDGCDPARSAALYLELARPEDAIRVWRDRGNITHALALAERRDEATTSLLRGLDELTRILVQLETEAGPSLTNAETEHLRVAFDQMMTSRAPRHETIVHAPRPRWPKGAARRSTRSPARSVQDDGAGAAGVGQVDIARR